LTGKKAFGADGTTRTSLPHLMQTTSGASGVLESNGGLVCKAITSSKVIMLILFPWLIALKTHCNLLLTDEEIS
jgi:hypothetical protein